MEENKFKDIAVDVAQAIGSNFTNENIIPKWRNYTAVSKFRSVKRAIRRGHVDLILGVVYPNRPYNNRKPTIGRSHNQLKRKIYEQLK